MRRLKISIIINHRVLPIFLPNPSSGSFWHFSIWDDLPEHHPATQLSPQRSWLQCNSNSILIQSISRPWELKKFHQNWPYRHSGYFSIISKVKLRLCIFHDYSWRSHWFFSRESISQFPNLTNRVIFVSQGRTDSPSKLFEVFPLQHLKCQHHVKAFNSQDQLWLNFAVFP